MNMFVLLILGIVLFCFGLFELYILVIPHHLSAKQINGIKTNGIIHFTTENATKDILSSLKVKSDSSHISYFFINQNIPLNIIEYNHLSSTEICINISNLSKKQINNLRIRKNDHALLYKNDFIIEPNNSIQCLKSFDKVICNNSKYLKLKNRAVPLSAACILVGIILISISLSKSLY